jgi:anionic cell wall polymer biosynthesis LytR-Cps2A-Psr (LCP) family protein
VRTRIDTDYGRAARQQEMVVSVARRILNRPEELNLRRLIRALSSLETDLPLKKLPTLLEIARRSEDARWVGQVLGPPRFALFQGIENGPRGWIMVPNVAEMRAYVRSVMGN